MLQNQCVRRKKGARRRKGNLKSERIRISIISRQIIKVMANGDYRAGDFFPETSRIRHPK